MVRRALAVGFTLDELGRIFGECDKSRAPCRKVHNLAAEKLAATEERIRKLLALREQLSVIVTNWDARLANLPEGERARLLETLPESQEKSLCKKSFLPPIVYK